MNQNYYQQGPNKPSDPTSTVCMILGICSIIFGFSGGCVGRYYYHIGIGCSVVGVICGLIGIVLYEKVKRANNGYVNGKALVGLVCGIVGISLSVLCIISTIVVHQITKGVNKIFRFFTDCT